MQMLKTETVRARVTPELKNSAEEIFAALGMSPSQAIVLFYKQVEIHNGLPFEVKVPPRKLENAAEFSKKRYDAELQRGYTSYTAGNSRPLSAARADFRRRHRAKV